MLFMSPVRGFTAMADQWKHRMAYFKPECTRTTQCMQSEWQFTGKLILSVLFELPLLNVTVIALISCHIF